MAAGRLAHGLPEPIETQCENSHLQKGILQNMLEDGCRDGHSGRGKETEDGVSIFS